MHFLFKLLGFREEMPLNWTPNSPAERRVSNELARKRELVARNDKNLARYLAEPEAIRRYRLHLEIQAALRRGRA